MFKKESSERFEVIYHDNGIASGCKIIVDRETGVNYLFSREGSAGGLTTLLDENGKPIVTLRK